MGRGRPEPPTLERSASGSANTGSQSTAGQAGNQTGNTTNHSGGASSMGGAAVGGTGPGQGGSVSVGGAFALASRYAGKHVGPGKLDLSGAGPSSSLAELVHTAILEGAVGETVASMEAAEALARASDPAVRAALTQIVEDEANHARLAWAFLHWALQTADLAHTDAADFCSGVCH